jgi:ATP-dependent protease ClpP protease subunit
MATTRRTRRVRTVERRQIETPLPLFLFDPERSVQYFGVVNYGTTERVIEEVTALYLRDPRAEIYLSVTSAGGPTGTAMSFYDHMHSILKPNLVTIGAGDVDSSGIIIFLTGNIRYVTRRTTLLLHRAGRIFDGGTRYTAAEIEAMFREDNIKDYQYASVLAERSHGKLTIEAVLALMERNTILTPQELVELGLADYILE